MRNTKIILVYIALQFVSMTGGWMIYRAIDDMFMGVVIAMVVGAMIRCRGSNKDGSYILCGPLWEITWCGSECKLAPEEELDDTSNV